MVALCDDHVGNPHPSRWARCESLSIEYALLKIDNYGLENIARSRARARGMRQMVLEGKLAENWKAIADDVDAYADERESK